VSDGGRETVVRCAERELDDLFPLVLARVWANRNTVYLSAQNPDLGLRRGRLAAMLRPLHFEVRHLALDSPGIGTAAAFRERLKEQL
jgi:hypothetical protein